ncbi:MAG: orotate phosphoribosyltransferase [Alphaproteobacteria bacterium]
MAGAAEPGGHGDDRARLRAIIAGASLRFGSFKLASGGESNVFIDLKQTLLDPEGLNLAADLILELLEGEEAEAVGGLVLGACPLVDAVCVKSLGRRPLTGFYVRKEPKGTGTQQMIEGPLAPGARVILLEDVTTRGGSALKAARVVRDDLGCTVTKVISVVDREQGARENLAAAGLELVSLFTMGDFLKVPHAPVRR